MGQKRYTDQNSILLLSLCHLLVDGISAAALFQVSKPLLITVLIYNTFAFTTQCLTGMLPDKYGHGKTFVLLSSVVLAAGALLPVPSVLKAIIVGSGNSLFHVSGGYLTLKNSNNMGPLGVFVAPGAIGLFIGTNYNKICLPFTLLLLLLSVILVLTDKFEAKEESADDRQKEETQTSITNGERFLLTCLLLLAVATRAVGGSVVSFPWKTGLILSGITVFCVFTGKTLGGIIADRYGIRQTAIVSIITASVLIVFFTQWMVPSLIGQIALNISMPITLYLIYLLYPDSPGFAFGIAAAALWPGTLIGKAIHLTGIWSGLLTVICFAIGLSAICIAEKKLISWEKQEYRKE